MTDFIASVTSTDEASLVEINTLRVVAGEVSSAESATLAYLRWLCVENPYRAAKVAAIRSDDRLAAISLMIPVPLQLGASAGTGYFIVEVLTHPDFRGKGLFSRLIEAMKAECSKEGSWLLGHPNRAALPGWTKKGMKFGNELVPRVLVPTLSPRRFRTICNDVAGWRHTDLSQIVELANSSTSSAMRPVVAPDESFFRWRFGSRPGVHYRLSALQRRGRAVAYVVSKAFKPGVELAVDWAIPTPVLWTSIGRPTILPLSQSAFRPLWGAFPANIPITKKMMPVFATPPDGSQSDTDGLTLIASDF